MSAQTETPAVQTHTPAPMLQTSPKEVKSEERRAGDGRWLNVGPGRHGTEGRREARR